MLVNNAGIMDSMDGPHETSGRRVGAVLRVNPTAPFLLTRAVLPIMLAKGKGAIVNTASEAGFWGSAAGTACHGVQAWGRRPDESTAVHVRGKGVRVNAVPWRNGDEHRRQRQPRAHGRGRGRRVHGNVGRIAEARELAAAIVFLASDAASNINGVILPVDNGWSAV